MVSARGRMHLEHYNLAWTIVLESSCSGSAVKSIVTPTVAAASRRPPLEMKSARKQDSPWH